MVKRDQNNQTCYIFCCLDIFVYKIDVYLMALRKNIFGFQGNL